MKTIVSLFLSLGLIGCADTGITTKIYEGGNIVMQTGADAATLDFRTAAGTSFHATGLQHSLPILANGQGTALIIDATGRVIGVIGAGVVGGLLAIPHPAAAAGTAAGSTVVSHVAPIINPTPAPQWHIQSTWVVRPTPTPQHNDSPPKD